MSAEVVLTISTRPKWKQWQFGVYDVRDVRVTTQARRLIEHDLRRFRVETVEVTALSAGGDLFILKATRRVTFSSSFIAVAPQDEQINVA
ncbi:hypothetical protein [Agromyces atrinae]|uniref:Uncharacterized protein n=1 Tax=Agromyces atrinae TaxID=592376 RepID=A0A4V1R2A4_9MICO|nr:hypothetical protein [Agromyces atrinae]NYD66122.1 hypothetical protein [Agromyces atrinae]RXZ86466.1 hypothetical protein ESP50_08650 [Agromyces atrinae]